MNGLEFKSRLELARAAADLMLADLAEHQESHWCLATGASPELLYAQIAASQAPGLQRLWTTKLDEWVGLAADHPSTCESYLKRHCLEPWGAPRDRYLSFDGTATDPQAECARIRQALSERPQLDWAVLGVGRNGHLGLNEPGETLSVRAHCARLAPQTQEHGMLGDARPTRGLTLGIGDLFQARNLLLIFSGQGKKEAFDRWCGEEIDTRWPVTLVRLHPGVHCFVCLD